MDMPSARECMVLAGYKEDFQPRSKGLASSPGSRTIIGDSRTPPVDATLVEVERWHIERVLERYYGVVDKAAKHLEMPRPTLVGKMKRMKLGSRETWKQERAKAKAKKRRLRHPDHKVSALGTGAER